MKLSLWTIQHINAYESLVKNGVLRANEEYLFCQDDLKYAYDWMAKELRERIGVPPAGIRYPIWAWYQWDGKRKRRDLRYSGYAPRGTPMVQIEFEVNQDLVLLSDFDDWHLVLNNGYIADSEQEFDEFYSFSTCDMQERTEKSWVKIFDIGKCIPNWTEPLDHKSIQATLWEINMSQVKKVEHFIAK